MSHEEWECPVHWTRKQFEGIRWRPPTHYGRQQRGTIAFLGEPGSGKTTVAAGYFQDLCLATSIRSTALDSRGVVLKFSAREPPMSGMVGLTISDVWDGPMKQLLRIMNPRMIRRERPYPPHNYLELINGHRIKAYTVKGAINGQNLCAIWPDEIQDPIYAKRFNQGTVFSNLVNRVRDLRAQRLGVVVSGHALAKTHVERWFRHTSDPTTKVIMMLQAENAANLGGNITNLRQRRARSEFDPDDTGWNKSHDTLWPFFSDANIYRAHPAEAFFDRPVFVGVDLRKHGAVVFAVKVDIDGRECLLVVDEWMPEGLSAGKIASGIQEKFRQWRVLPGWSKICIDPSSAIDEIEAFSEMFPGVEIVRFMHGPLHTRAGGIRAVDTAILNAEGERRLFVHERLIDNDERGVYAALRSYDGTGHDNTFEHAADGLRYAVCVTLGLVDVVETEEGGLEAS